MTEKHCSKCGLDKQPGEFRNRKSTKDGLDFWCRECSKASERRWYAKSDTAAEKRRAGTARWRKAHPDKKSEEGKRYPRKQRNASALLNHYVRVGKIAKPDKCSMCGASGKLHGHHDDYDKPLAVRWVCRPCHYKIHWADRGTCP